MWKTSIGRCLTFPESGSSDTTSSCKSRTPPIGKSALTTSVDSPFRWGERRAEQPDCTRHVTDPELKVTKTDGGPRWRTL